MLVDADDRRLRCGLRRFHGTDVARLSRSSRQRRQYDFGAERHPAFRRAL